MSILREVALVTFQETVLLCPKVMLLGLAVKETITGTGILKVVTAIVLLGPLVFPELSKDLMLKT